MFYLFYLVFVCAKRAGSISSTYHTPITTGSSDVLDTDIFDASSDAFDPTLVFDTLTDDGIDVLVTHSVTDKISGITHIHAIQTIDDIPVFKSVGNINIKPDRKLVASHHQFRKPERLRRGGGSVDITTISTPVNANPLHEIAIGQGQAKEIFLDFINVPGLWGKDEVLGYIRDDNGDLVLCWRIYFIHDLEMFYYVAYIEADYGKILEYHDLVVRQRTPYQYNVYAAPLMNPSEGPRSIVIEPFDDDFAPLGWQGEPDDDVSDETDGNNVIAEYKDIDTGNTAEADDEIFDFDIDFTEAPDKYSDACTVQLFYSCNWIHDVFYRFGFDEPSGNFQKENFDRGGLGDDPIRAICQSKTGENNANFFTEVDGGLGKMQMYRWTAKNPDVASSFDTGVVIHEFAHGVSNRLVGGADDNLCLSSNLASGMGEGWSDFFALFFLMKEGQTRNDLYLIAEYLVTSDDGIRTFPYTSVFSLNPTTYKYINLYFEVHQLGEVWTQMLFEAAFNAIEAYGFQENVLDDSHSTSGNHRILEAVVDGLKMTSCSPSFIIARDAVLEGARLQTQFLTNLVWAGFAKRGMGCSATESGIEDYDYPRGCQQSLCVPQCYVETTLLNNRGSKIGDVESTVELDGKLSFHVRTKESICAMQLNVGTDLSLFVYQNPNTYPYIQSFHIDSKITSTCIAADITMPLDQFQFIYASLHVTFCSGVEGWAFGTRFEFTNWATYYPLYKCGEGLACTHDDQCQCLEGPCVCSLTGDCQCEVDLSACSVDGTCTSCPGCDSDGDCTCGDGGPCECNLSSSDCACLLEPKSCGEGTICDECSIPTNTICENAEEIDLSTGSAVIKSSTIYGEVAEEENICGGSNESPALWYKFTAPGGDIETSTCNTGGDFDTWLTIMEGSCGDFDCVTSNDDDCTQSRTKSTVVFDTDEDEEYYILMHGWDTAAGIFHLTVIGMDRCLDGGGSGDDAVHGMMFDVKALSPLDIEGLRSVYHSVGTNDVLVSYREGSAEGFENIPDEWPIYQAFPNVNFDLKQLGEELQFATPIHVDQGRTVSFYITTPGTGMFQYSSGAKLGNKYASNKDIELRTGYAVSYPFKDIIPKRNWNGHLCYFAYPTESGGGEIGGLIDSDEESAGTPAPSPDDGDDDAVDLLDSNPVSQGLHELPRSNGDGSLTKAGDISEINLLEKLEKKMSNKTY